MKTKQMSELERRAMEVLWRKKISCIRDIALELSRVKPVAYTTVLTVMQRLYEKGLVTRKEKEKRYMYSPKVTKASYTKSLAQTFLSMFFTSFGDTAITSFVESIEDLPEKKRKQLLSLLEKHDAGK